MRIYKALIAFLGGIWILASLLCLPVSAAQIVDLSKSPSLTIEYQKNHMSLGGALFGLYYVADVDAYGKFTLAGDFSDYPVVVNDLDEEGFRKLAYTLEGYILRDNLQPAMEKRTGVDGTVTFDSETDGLKLGLYLVQGEQHEQDGYSFDAHCFMVALPSIDENTNEQMYNMTARPKSRAYPTAVKPDSSISYKVLKVWDDEGYASERPNTLTVQLLRDGAVYDTVKLNSENDWRYVWKDLDARCTWTVVEVEEPNYTVTVIRSGTTFVVTNSYYKDSSTQEPVAPPTDTDTDTDTGVTTPPEEPKLPYTGQLWCPVPVLLTAGLVLVVVGLARRRGSNYEE